MKIQVDQEFKVSGKIVTVDILDYDGVAANYVVTKEIDDPDCSSNSLQEEDLNSDHLTDLVLEHCKDDEYYEIVSGKTADISDDAWNKTDAYVYTNADSGEDIIIDSVTVKEVSTMEEVRNALVAAIPNHNIYVTVETSKHVNSDSIGWEYTICTQHKCNGMDCTFFKGETLSEAVKAAIERHSN